MFMVCAAAKGHVGAHGPMAVRGCVDVCGPCYYQRPGACQWSVLLPESMLVSMASAVTEGHEGVCGLLQPRVVLMSVA